MQSDHAEVQLSTDIENLTVGQLEGFFEGWPTKPAPEQLLLILRSSYRAVIAREESGRLVGIATSISDGTLSAFIPLVEVLPEYRGGGIGTALMRRMLEELSGVYAVDLTCDEDVAPFYERLGMVRTVGMSLRDSIAVERLAPSPPTAERHSSPGVS